MRRILFTIFLLVPTCLMAQEKLTRAQKKYIKTAQELDILSLLPESTDFNPTTFWNCITRNNTELQKTLALFENPKGLARDAYNKVEDMKFKNYSKNIYYNPETEGHVNSTFHHALLGDDWSGDKIVFRIEPDKSVNAFSSPDGFIYIYEGLMNKVEGNSTMINGALAHEVAHYLFRHMLVHEYMTLKRERKNNIGAAIAVLGTGIANIAAASGGASTDPEIQKQNYQGIIDGAKEWTDAYHYRYGREEEMVSDIVAYRFLEWTGRDPEQYIKLIEILGLYGNSGKTERYDDHPSSSDRIGVLRALKPAPWSE